MEIKKASIEEMRKRISRYQRLLLIPQQKVDSRLLKVTRAPSVLEEAAATGLHPNFKGALIIDNKEVAHELSDKA